MRFFGFSKRRLKKRKGAIYDPNLLAALPPHLEKQKDNNYASQEPREK